MRKEIYKTVSLLISFSMIIAVFTTWNVQDCFAAETLTENSTGEQNGYSYELWKDNGNTTMTLGDNGNFSCSWSNINNALFRRGVRLDSTQTYSQLGDITVEYACEYKPSGNSYLCVYGWSVDPLVEYYIVDSWGTWRPPGADSKGTISIDGGTYDIYETTRTNQPSIQGNTTFKQYWSVRTQKKDSGTISVSDHFKAWEKLGMKLGKMYEVSFTVEGYQSSGSANVTKNIVTIGGKKDNDSGKDESNDGSNNDSDKDINDDGNDSGNNDAGKDNNDGSNNDNGNDNKDDANNDSGTDNGEESTDSQFTMLDVCAIQRGIQNGFSDDNAKNKADIDKNGTVDENDVNELLNRIARANSNVKTDDTDTDDSSTDNSGPSDSNDSQPNDDNANDNSSETDDSKSSIDMSEIQKQIVGSEPSDATQEKQNVKYGTIEKKTFYSDVCKRQKNMNILLPANYSSSKKYPVLYALHGFWGNEDSLTDAGDASLKLRQIIGNAIASGEANEMIVVFPDIYASATQDKCSAMDANNVAAYNNFVNVLIKEIMPYMEKNYPIKTGSKNTAITGFSMGGMESLTIGMSRPDLFGYVGGICSAPGLSTNNVAENCKKLNLLMISAGSNDNVVNTVPVGYHDDLTSKNITHVWHYVNGGAHGGNTIRPHMYNFVRYLFK